MLHTSSPLAYMASEKLVESAKCLDCEQIPFSPRASSTSDTSTSTANSAKG
jgi:hypothetical protein